MNVKNILKPLTPSFIISFRRAIIYRRNIKNSLKPICQRECPICGYQGHFDLFGRPPRLDAKCKGCGSLERHRLFWLWYQNDRPKMDEPILHFAAEHVISDRLRKNYIKYTTADINSGYDMILNIENIDLPTGSVNTVICNHVLEHVSDKVALSEIYRLLGEKGKLICSTPIIEGWEKTYENEQITSPIDKEIHFGQNDHVRYYGRDFRDRLHEAGFVNIQEITAEGKCVIDYGLLRGEKLFVCKKS